MSDDDRTLLLRLRRGELPAAEMLWRRHGGTLRAYAAALLGRLGGDVQADDIAQNVFCRVLSLDPARLETVRDVGPWLLTLARHAVHDEARRARRDRARLRATPRTISSGPNVAGDLGLAVAALPRPQREAVVLRFVAGLTFDQMALTLGVPRTTAATRLTAGLEALRRRLDTTHGRDATEVTHAAHG